jgi:hypothetical protein
MARNRYYAARALDIAKISLNMIVLILLIHLFSFLSLHWTVNHISISTPRGEAYYEFSSVYTNHTRTLVLDSSNPLITDVTVRPASLHLRRLDKHSFVKPSTREEVFTASPSFRGYGMEGLEANNRIFNRLYRRTCVSFYGWQKV